MTSETIPVQMLDATALDLGKVYLIELPQPEFSHARLAALAGLFRELHVHVIFVTTTTGHAVRLLESEELR